MFMAGERYRAVSHDLESGDFLTTAKLRYFALEPGASFRF
jgi:hypothetical protein